MKPNQDNIVAMWKACRDSGAAEIDALRAEVARLTAELDRTQRALRRASQVAVDALATRYREESKP